MAIRAEHRKSHTTDLSLREALGHIANGAMFAAASFLFGATAAIALRVLGVA